MPRVTHVKRALKPNTCGKCGATIEKGQPYRWWKFRFGGRRVRCTKTECSPRRSELTTSSIYATAWDAQDDAGEAIGAAGSLEELRDAVEQCKDSVSELVDEFDEKLSNIESGFGHTDLPVYEELEERKGTYEEWQQELEGVELDAIDVSVTIDATEEHEAVEISFSLEEWDDDEVKTQIVQGAGRDLTETEVTDAIDDAQEQWEQGLEDARSAAQDAVDACPE